MAQNIIIRPASFDEIPEMNTLIQASSNKLGTGFYTAEEIASLNEFVFGVDQELIEDQTYFIIEKNGQLAACGGWSRRKTLFGGDQSSSRVPGYLQPGQDAAKIRAFFIHPEYARQGIGSLLLNHCETEARKAGFTTAELMATLPGVPFYKTLGYEGNAFHSLDLPNGVTVMLLPMKKTL